MTAKRVSTGLVNELVVAAHEPTAPGTSPEGDWPGAGAAHAAAAE